MDNFKPMQPPHDNININKIKYPVLASYQIAGFRCIFKDGRMVSKSLNDIPNNHLQDKFNLLKRLSKNRLIIDGVIYSHKRTLPEITRACMTPEFSDNKIIKELRKKFGDVESTINYINRLLADMKFYCFDVLFDDTSCFSKRLRMIKDIKEYSPDAVVGVKQTPLNYVSMLRIAHYHAIKKNYDGLILKDPDGLYKFGRVAADERQVYKIKIL